MTPSAFDRDFNFITGIERSLERADRDAETRGISLESPADNERPKRRRDVVRGAVALQKGIEACGATVVKAPKGMLRNKQNTSHWHKKYFLQKLPFYILLDFNFCFLESS